MCHSLGPWGSLGLGLVKAHPAKSKCVERGGAVIMRDMTEMEGAHLKADKKRWRDTNFQPFYSLSKWKKSAVSQLQQRIEHSAPSFCPGCLPLRQWSLEYVCTLWDHPLTSNRESEIDDNVHATRRPHDDETTTSRKLAEQPPPPTNGLTSFGQFACADPFFTS